MFLQNCKRLIPALRKCDIFCEHITAKKELLQLVLKHRRNPSIWHQLASSLEGLAVFANGEPWEQFLLTAVGHRVVDDSVKGQWQPHFVLACVAFGSQLF